MTDFENCFLRLIDEVEGREYTNHKDDDGGPTKFGITQSTLSRFYGRPASIDDVKNLTETTASFIYRDMYWEPLQLDRVHCATTAWVLFNQAVNFGPGKIARQTQVILVSMGHTLTVDGIFGPMSVNALNEAPPKDFLAGFIKSRYVSYARSAVQDPGDLKFLVGWMNRTNKLLDELLRMS